MKKKFKNKLSKFGFTLIELLGVIVLLAIIALIATPIINDALDDSKESANLRSIEGYARAIKQEYYNQSMSGGKPVIDSTFLSNVATSGGKIVCESINYNVNNSVIMYNCVVENSTKKYCYAKEQHYGCDDSEFLTILGEFNYKDSSGANSPELLNNMIPIKYENDNWIVADVSQEWYDYDSKEWANAVVLNKTKNVGEIVNEEDIDLWYVWVPRYKYKLFNANNEGVPEQEIEIQFESGSSTTGTVKCTDNISGTDGTTSSQTCTNASNGAWYTHPAFTFGEQELTGFWVGKFEVSGNIDKITIKPNISSLRSQTVSSFFTAIQNINTTYSLNGDSHMMKNMEWGAVAYLSHSKYGINEEVGINNNSSYITGCGAVAGSSSSSSCNTYNTTNGMLASTTGNIYGVYDMSGGAWEYVMGNMVNSSGDFYSSSSGFSEAPNSKYYDSYTYGNSSTTHGRGKLGDATKETLKSFGSGIGGWYSDYAGFPTSSDSWFGRGGNYNAGSYAGVFTFSRYSGGAYSTSARAVVCVRE